MTAVAKAFAQRNIGDERRTLFVLSVPSRPIFYCGFQTDTSAPENSRPQNGDEPVKLSLLRAGNAADDPCRFGASQPFEDCSSVQKYEIRSQSPGTRTFEFLEFARRNSAEI